MAQLFFIFVRYVILVLGGITLFPFVATLQWHLELDRGEAVKPSLLRWVPDFVYAFTWALLVWPIAVLDILLWTDPHSDW